MRNSVFNTESPEDLIDGLGPASSEGIVFRGMTRELRRLIYKQSPEGLWAAPSSRVRAYESNLTSVRLFYEPERIADASHDQVNVFFSSGRYGTADYIYRFLAASIPASTFIRWFLGSTSTNRQTPNRKALK